MKATINRHRDDFGQTQYEIERGSIYGIACRHRGGWICDFRRVDLSGRSYWRRIAGFDRLRDVVALIDSL